MREIKVDNFFAKGFVREDGRMVHDMLLVEVKKPDESKVAWDYYKVLRTIAADDAGAAARPEQMRLCEEVSHRGTEISSGGEVCPYVAGWRCNPYLRTHHRFPPEGEFSRGRPCAGDRSGAEGRFRPKGGRPRA